MPLKIKIAIADDHKLFREGLAALLESFEELTVSIIVSNGNELFEELLKRKRPIDVLLLDVEMPEMDGIEVLKKLKATKSSIKPLILTMHNEDELIYGLVEQGARGFLQKSSDIEEVVDAIYKLQNDELYFNNEISKRVIQKLVKKEYIKRLEINKTLSEREKEIIRLICHEFTTKEIAEKLFLSERTIETHKQNIFDKTNSKNSVGLAVYAMRTGLIE